MARSVFPKILGMLGLMAMGSWTVSSCIIPDKGIVFIDPDCGFQWCGQAVNAHGVNGVDNWADILKGGDWVKGCVCFSEGSDEVLTTGLALGCHEATTPIACNNLGMDCEWKTNVEGSGVDLMIFDAGEDHVLHLANGLYRLALTSGVNEMATLSVAGRWPARRATANDVEPNQGMRPGTPC